MEPDIFRFIYKYSKREQIVLLAITAISYPFFYFSLNIPKDIINHLNSVVKHIDDGHGARTAADYPVQALFDLAPLDAYSYLFALCGMFLGLVLLNGAFKYIINVMSGRTGERLLRRLRYQLYTRMLRFPLPQFRKTSQGELIAMITAEVEPLGGFMGTAVSDPIYQGGLLMVPLIFILVQDPLMGFAAMMLYPAQAYFIPKMQRKVNELGKQRVRTVRKLAERIGEVVTGVQEVHANDATLIERADFADRVGKIYEIRYRIFLLKFLVKYINNTLDKLTPFFFYALGGYLVFTGKLNIGALVAVIGAHKELAAPWKELLQYYQDKEDARIKYDQVVAQFEPAGMMDDHSIDDEAEKYGPLEGSIIATNVSVTDDSGGTSVNGLDLTVPFDAHVAVVGGAGSGKEEVGLLFSRLMMPTSGNLMMGQHRAVDLPEAVTGRQLAYVGPSSILFNASVRDNLYYGLKHRPLADMPYTGVEAATRRRYISEAQMSGNTPSDLAADWIDYSAAGVRDMADLTAKTITVLRGVELGEDVYQFGLRGMIDATARPEVAGRMLQARRVMRQRLTDPEIAPLVEQYNRDSFNSNASVAENLLFGTPLDEAFQVENLARNDYVLHVLREVGLYDDFLSIARKVAETMVELFADIAPGHPFFEQFSFISSDDLPEFQTILARVAKVGLEAISADDRARLMTLPFKLIPARHRLDLVGARMQVRIIEARHYFAENLPEQYKNSVEFFDFEHYNSTATLQDNILFGKVAYGQAQGLSRLGGLITEILDHLHLYDTVMEVGLDYHVGIGGTRLTLAQRQKLAIARALLRQPTLLIANEALAPLDSLSQAKILSFVLQQRRGRGVLWILHRASMAASFDDVVVMQNGRVVETGRFDQLKQDGSRLSRLLAAE